MDIHRCRFVDYNPSAIQALAFSHPLPANPRSTHIPPSLRLAVGRANGSIEIWNPQSNWFHENTLHGGLGRSVEGLVWIQQEDSSLKKGTIGRLFSIGYSTVVTEWDLTTGKPLKHFDCNKGVIWSIAAQPRKESSSNLPQEENTSMDDNFPNGQQLVVGCEDGSLVVIDTEGAPGSMSFVRAIAQSRASRVLSLAYQTPHVVVAGMSDSKLRVFDTRNGRTTATMSVGQNAGQKDVHIWRVKCLPGPGNWIVAGDSRGEVTFWDGKRYALRQRVKGHEADIMSLETDSKGTRLFSSGIDRRTVMYELVGKKTNRGWVEVSARRFHKHDVLAMASYEAGNMSVLISGGVDMTPIILPLRNWSEEYHRVLPAVPQTPIISTAPSARLVVAHFEKEIKIWKIDDLDGPNEINDEDLFGLGHATRGRRLVGRAVMSGDENITSSAVTSDGSLLAVATTVSIKLFQLRSRKTQGHALKFTKLPLDSKIAALGGRLVNFSADGRWLCCVTPESVVHLVHVKVHNQDVSSAPTIELPTQSIKLKRKEKQNNAKKILTLKDGTLGHGGRYGSQIHRTTFSSNGTILAVTDLGGWIDCWERDESDTWISLTEKSPLPRLDASALTIGFRPSHNVGPPSTPEQLLVEDSIDHLGGLPPSTPRATSLQLLHSQHQQIVDTTSDTHHGLFVLTTAHTLHEFDVRAGTLTAWSKRNPSEKLPQAFLKNMDRASGMNFTSEPERGLRLWLWGASWVWMFNIDKDLIPDQNFKFHHQTSSSIENKQSNSKRKRSSFSGKSKAEVVFMSGAGSKIPSNASGHVQINGRDHMPKPKLAKQQTLNQQNSDDDEDEEDETEEFLVDIVKSRRPSMAITNYLIDDDNAMDVDNDEVAVDDKIDNGTALVVTKSPEGARKEKISWHTGKYRPLMAFLPIGKPNERIEMVVVERPLYDIALPPRFEDKRDVGR